MRNSLHLDLTFGTEGSVKPYLLYGWQVPEPGLNWTDGSASAILIPGLKRFSGATFVEVTCGSVEEPSCPPQTLAVKINGAPESLPILVSHGTYAWMVPQVSSLDRATILQFLHPDSVRLSTLGISSDTRLLSIAMRRLRVLVAETVQPTRRTSSVVLDGDSTKAAEAVTGISTQDLVMQFESLGDNCELGLVQRRLGGEPLSLLRFSTAFLDPVLRGVDTNFSGLGDHLDAAMEGVEREWMIRDHGYELRWHTFILGESSSRQFILEREIKKISFLKEKFVRDLKAAEKIFVVKSRDRLYAEQQILALHLALCRHAENWLLWITPAEDASKVGLVEEISPRLLRGHIDRFSRHNVSDDESISGWLSVLVNAWLLARG